MGRDEAGGNFRRPSGLGCQLGEGESISGWMFFELDPEVRGLDYKIKEINLTFENTTRDRQMISLNFGAEHRLTGESALSSGQWNLTEDYYDLTKEHYTLTPKMDLQDALKRPCTKSESFFGTAKKPKELDFSASPRAPTRARAPHSCPAWAASARAPA